MTATTTVEAPTFHIGERCRYGNLDWFPVWSQDASATRAYKTNTRARLQLEESADPDHTLLEARNLQDEPLALFEGTLFSAGYQHRALTRTVILAPHQWEELPVVCVEKGRWDADPLDSDDEDDDEWAELDVAAHMAPLRVRHAMRGVRKVDGTFADMFDSFEPEQERVWQEVTRYQETTRLGTTTGSLLELETAYRDTFDLERSTPLPGQTGVIVAHGGYPVWLEAFDHPETLAERFEMILNSVRLDSHELPYTETPGRRARRFAHVVAGIDTTPDRYNVGCESRHRSQANPYVVSESVRFADHTVHLTALNASHPLFH